MSINNMCEVNLSNEKEFDQCLELLDEAQLHNYHYAFSPYKKENLKYTEEFFSNARFIVYSNAAFARTYCCCGMSNKANPSGKCCIRQYCPKCAWSYFRKVSQPFEHSFLKGTFQHITLSYNGYVAPGHECQNLDDIKIYWNAAHYALNKAAKGKYIRGGLASCEIHVHGYLPLLLNAHVHAIIDADPLTEAVQLQMSTWMSEYITKEIGTDTDEEASTPCPNVKVVPIEDEKAFMNAIKYIVKPLNLAPAYRSTWIDKVVETPSLARMLNSQLKDLIVGMSWIKRDERLFRRFGNMHSASKYYIGDKTQDNENHDEECEDRIAA
jgi:hypothetical protein